MATLGEEEEEDEGTADGGDYIGLFCCIDRSLLLQQGR